MKKRGLLTAWILVVLLVLAGCSTSDGGTSTTSTSTKTGGILNISLYQDPPKLDPYMSSSLSDRQVFQSIFDKLVDLDEKGNIVPMLADKWDISADQKTYTFKLHEGVKFQDGTDFNAEAVKFNIERYMNKESARATELSEIKNITVVDPNTIKMELKEPFAPFLSILTDRAGMMGSPAAIQQYGKDFMSHPVGTGPFIYKDRVKGATITLAKNPNYWQKGLPKLDGIVYKIMTDANVALMNLKSEQVDITNQFPFKEISNYQNDPKITAISKPGLGFKGIYLNVTKPPFDQKELRQAVDLLIDRDALVKVVLNGAGTPGHSVFSPMSFAYGDSDKYQAPNLEKAKTLLTQAGKSSGFSFTLKIDTTPDAQQAAQMIQSMLQPAGIQVNIQKLEFGTLLDESEKGIYEATWMGWSGRPDPDQNIYDWYATGGFNNYMKYSNKQVDNLMSQARANSDPAKRKDIYDQTMKILNDEVPYIVLYHDHNALGVSKAVQGFKYVPDGMIRTVNLSK